jgi:hypothetical protein
VISDRDVEKLTILTPMIQNGVCSEACVLERQSRFSARLCELGDALGLGHNLSGFAMMRPTDAIADEAPAEMPFRAIVKCCG